MRVSDHEEAHAAIPPVGQDTTKLLGIVSFRADSIAYENYVRLTLI